MSNSAVDFIKEKLLASTIFGEIFANGFEKTFEEAKKMEDETISKLKEKIDDLENQILEIGERN
jgi:hypothetical protein